MKFEIIKDKEWLRYDNAFEGTKICMLNPLKAPRIATDWIYFCSVCGDIFIDGGQFWNTYVFFILINLVNYVWRPRQTTIAYTTFKSYRDPSPPLGVDEKVNNLEPLKTLWLVYDRCWITEKRSQRSRRLCIGVLGRGRSINLSRATAPAILHFVSTATMVLRTLELGCYDTALCDCHIIL